MSGGMRAPARRTVIAWRDSGPTHGSTMDGGKDWQACSTLDTFNGCRLIRWLENCLDVLTGKHVFKAVFPLFHPSDTADDEIQIDLASRDHVDHTLPDGPVV